MFIIPTDSRVTLTVAGPEASAGQPRIGSRAHLDTTTKPAVDSLSPRRRSGERGRVGFQKSATISMEAAVPLSPALSPLVPRRERGHFSDGGCIKMRPRQYRHSEFTALDTGTGVVQGKDKSRARPGSFVREIVLARLLLRGVCRMNDGVGGAGQRSHGEAPGELVRRLATREVPR